MSNILEENESLKNQLIVLTEAFNYMITESDDLMAIIDAETDKVLANREGELGSAPYRLGFNDSFKMFLNKRKEMVEKRLEYLKTLA